jgi:hypothetical protein
VLFRSAVGVVFFTSLAEFVRVFAGIPVTWGTAALDVVVVTLPTAAALWLQANLTPADSVAAATPTPPVPITAAVALDEMTGPMAA